MSKVRKIQYYLSLFFKFFVVFLIFLGFWERDYFLIFASIFVLFLMFLPAIINRSFKLILPTEFDFTLSLVLFLHYVLGEYSGFYVKLHWWDIFLHAGNSIILGMVGLAFSYALLMTSKIKAKPFFVSLFSFTFTVSIGVIWEIFEFGMDQFFGFNMQKSGLKDTMGDLIVDFLGALFVSVVGFIYIKNPKTPDNCIHGIIQNIIDIETHI